ncbi:hypothetical protein [Paenibacillus qinlingensis]|nr:hypothetical protein [Paenibacillus qinlingensis]
MSTGVLNRAPFAVTAVIHLMNMERHDAQKVVVEVWDWSTCATPSRVTLRMGADEPAMLPFHLEAQSLAVLYAEIDESIELYEIRLVDWEEQQVMTSVWKKRSQGHESYLFQEGHKSLQPC